MPELPDDPRARQAELERWASEQWLEDQRPTGIPWRSLADGVAKAPGQVAGASALLANRVLDRGLRTAGDVHRPEHAHADRVHYVPTAWHVLPRALRTLEASDRDTFIDFGCGKGRVVHQAAKRPFRRVVGVEISEELAEIARRGLAARRREHRCPQVEIVVSDAAAFPIPEDLTIAFLFDPFSAGTLDAVLNNLVGSLDRHPRRLRLIFVHPRCGAQVLATGRFRLVSEQRGGLKDIRLFRTALFESC